MFDNIYEVEQSTVCKVFLCVLAGHLCLPQLGKRHTIQKAHFEEIEIFHFSYHETGCRAMSSQKFSKLPIEFYHPSENSQLETATKLTIETASQSLRMEKVYFTSFSSYLSYFGKTPRMVKVILVLVKHVVKHFWPTSCV